MGFKPETPNEWAMLYGYWGEAPGHPFTDWQAEVANGDTRKGYWEWVCAREKEGDE